MHIIPGTNIVFMHIPKCAGQSIRETFKMHSVDHAHSYSSTQDKEWINGNYIRFCVVRDPVQRFISSYKYNVRWSKHKESGLAAEIKNLKADTDINDYVDVLMRRKKEFDRFAHIRPQSYFLFKTKPKIILRQETLGSDIGIISKLANLGDIELISKNTSPDVSESSSVNTVLTKNNRGIVEKFYARDFLFLGYPVASNFSE